MKVQIFKYLNFSTEPFIESHWMNQAVDHLHIPPLPLCDGETSSGDDDDNKH